MLRGLSAGFIISVALANLGLTGSASAQLPTRSSEPRLAVPRTELPVVQPPGQPTATTTAAEPASQPTAAVPPDTTTSGSGSAPVTQVTGGASGVTTVGGGTPATSSSTYAATATSDRAYATGKSVLTLSGIQVATLNNVVGGTATSDVVLEKLGPDHVQKKHVSGVKYEDLSFAAGLDSKPLLDWVAASFAGQYTRKDGSILGLDYSNTVRSELTFFQALPTRLTIPTLDAAGKDAASLTVTLAPEYTRLTHGSGAKGPLPKAQQRWSTSGFRFEMAGLDGSRVNRIESITIQQKVVDNAVGESRDYQKEPAALEYSNVKVSLSASSAQTWQDWYNDFLINGNNGDDKERDGAIVFLSQSLTELGRLNLYHCGIYRLAPKPQDSRSEAIARLTAELYCERMELVTKN
jgi:T4-like virus tail tube protein gp19